MKWIQQARESMKRRGTVGSFTAQAKRAGMTTSEFANYVLSHKSEFDTKTIRRAVFARNVRK